MATRPTPDRLALLAFLAAFLFAGALRAFLSSVYYQNLAELELNATAAYALLLLSPAVMLVPALRARPHAAVLAGALLLSLGRAAQPFARGTPLLLPATGLAAAAYMAMLVALLRLTEAPRAAAGVALGTALGWALDLALRWWGDSLDPTLAPRGLLLALPAAILLVLIARAPLAAPPRPAGRAPWLAGVALGAWLFLQNVVGANPYGAARWNGAEPAPVAAAMLAGALAGVALCAALDRWPPALVWGAQLALLAGLADHALLHSPLAPLTLGLLEAALVVDLALLARALAGRDVAGPFALGALVMLAAHFVYAFTFLFDYVPLGALWKGKEALLFLVMGALVALAAGRARDVRWTRERALPVRAATLALAPLMVAAAAGFTPGAAVAEPQDDTLRVLSFNVHQAFANDGVLDPDVFAALLRAEDPDVVLLQEADTPRFTSGDVDVAGYLAQTLGYHLAYGQPTRAQAFGGAILSRHPIVEWHTHPLPSNSDNRWFTEAKLDVAGKEVWVASVHFGLPREDRLAQTTALLQHYAERGGPYVVAGDFNSCPHGLCPEGQQAGDAVDDIYPQLTARLDDAWVRTGGDANDTAAWTYDATQPYERIDYAFVTADVEVVSYRVVRTDAAVRASDHLPVAVELRL